MRASLRKGGGLDPRRRGCAIEPLEGRQLLTAVVFTVNPMLSSLTLSGTTDGTLSLMAQAPGSLTTQYSGTIDADVESSSIQFTNTSAVAAENSGMWAPGIGVGGNYGAFVGTGLDQLSVGIYGLVASGSSGVLPVSANGDFSSTSQMLNITAGSLNINEGTLASTESLVGLTASNASLQTSSYTVASGKATVYLPITATYTTSVIGADDTQLTLTGQIVATATAPVLPASISGNVRAASPMQNETVFIDTHNFGPFQKGDPTTTTDASGNYTFQGLGAGTYIVRQMLPAGFTQTSPWNNYGDHITLTAGENYMSGNFSDVESAGTITGTITAPGTLPTMTVYLDVNNNGKMDSGEPKAVTNAFGSYVFTGINPGNYIIRQMLPSGYKQLLPTHAYGIHTAMVVGHSIVNANFTDALNGVTTGSISGTVFSDDNGNGIIDSGEIGLSDWEMYIDLNNSHLVTGNDPTTYTDTNGNFTFSHLSPGPYLVRVWQQPAWIQTYPLESLGDQVTLNAGENITGLLFGEISDG